jgi:hypothetical protein
MQMDVQFNKTNVLMETKFNDFQTLTIPVGGTVFEVDETLSLENGILSVNTSKEPEPDNTLPITSAAVHINVAQIMNILNGLIARIEALENGTVIQPDETSAVLGTAILDKMVLA